MKLHVSQKQMLNLSTAEGANHPVATQTILLSRMNISGFGLFVGFADYDTNAFAFIHARKTRHR